jgi:hypothetical protein
MACYSLTVTWGQLQIKTNYNFKSLIINNLMFVKEHLIFIPCLQKILKFIYYINLIIDSYTVI